MPLRRKPSAFTSPLTLDPSSSALNAPRTSMESSPDSGYASGSSPGTMLFPPHGYAHTHQQDAGWLPPHPDYVLSRTYESWRIADAATQRLIADLRLLETRKTQLRAAKKRQAQEQKSPKPSRKPSLLQIPFRKKPMKSEEAVPPIASSASSSSSSSSQAGLPTELPTVKELEEQLQVLNQRVAATQPAAERLDALFEELRKVLDDGRPTSWQSSVSTSSSGHGHTGQPFADGYTRARKAVSTREQSYSDSKATTMALQHACIAVQSAHHHYSTSMDLLDAVCSPKKARWEAMMGDEQSRQETYREATEWAKKAQMCFNECVRSLTPHWELLKRDELQDIEDLKETGLLQALQLYNLMYGGKVLAMGITQQVQIMTQKQEAVFARLTSFAVWVQDCTKFCETVELEAREQRDAARRDLVALWVKADEESEMYSLAAPSENSHVFYTVR